MEAQIEQLKQLIENAKLEIERCKTSIGKTVGIIEDTSNCLRELDCVSSNLKQGLVIDGNPKGEGVVAMANQLTSFNTNMEANVLALQDRITTLEENIVEWEAQIAALEAEIARQAEEAEYRANHPILAAIKSGFSK